MCVLFEKINFMKLVCYTWKKHFFFFLPNSGGDFTIVIAIVMDIQKRTKKRLYFTLRRINRPSKREKYQILIFFKIDF